MRAYYYDNVEGDPQAPHDSAQPVAAELLNALGIIYMHIDSREGVDAMAAERGYKNSDELNISEAGFGGKQVYYAKLKEFFKEHIHDDEEIRYVIDGDGYFDVRDAEDNWIRCYVEKHDLLILPAGIYHRFTPSEKNYMRALRLFQEDPKWTPLNRPAEDNAMRQRYLKALRARVVT